MSETNISILMNNVCNNLPFLGPDKALYSCACDIHPLREDKYHSERSTSFLERSTSKQ